MKLPTIAELWEEYAKACLPADAPAIQYDTCKLTFYSGIWTFMRGCLANAGHTGDPAKTAATMLGWDHEAEKWLADVAKGEIKLATFVDLKEMNIPGRPQ